LTNRALLAAYTVSPVVSVSLAVSQILRPSIDSTSASHMMVDSAGRGCRGITAQHSTAQHSGNTAGDDRAAKEEWLLVSGEWVFGARGRRKWATPTANKTA
jgi:hypothetical protein